MYDFKDYVFAGNGLVALECLKFMKELDLTCLAIVVHPDDRARNKPEFLNLAKSLTKRIWLPNELNNNVKENPSLFKDSILISVYYGFIFPPYVFNSFKDSINLHPALLPYNRGVYPNVWSIIEKTPSGVTIHEINEKIDAGKILVQKRVSKHSYDTGKTLYEALEKTSIQLFIESIQKILKSEIEGWLPKEKGTFHFKKNVNEVDEIDLDQTYAARDLLNLIRARTFETYPSAYYIDKEEKLKVYVRLQFETQRME